MLGVETEYAFALLDHRGRRLDPSWSLEALLESVRQRLPYLSESTGGVFLSTGGRLYVDCGHPELTTPECTSPAEAVGYVEAGHLLLGDVMQALSAEHRRIGRTFLGRCHVDYVNGATWGCHESYLHRSNPATLPSQLIPHLVTRIVYTGSGGFNNRSPGIEFLLEPRTPHLLKPVSRESTQWRGIFHSKNETLSSAGHNRLHVLAGSSNCSHLANWLKLGTTTLIVAIVEEGARPGAAVQLADPVGSLQTVSRDVECQASLDLKLGGTKGAIEIQRHYLEQVKARLGEPFMPGWAAQVCHHWQEVLEVLSSRPQALCRTLDWPLRLMLYQQYAASQGSGWTENRPQTDDPEVMEALRSELWQIDTRFGEIGGDGIFEELQRTQCLDHAAPGVAPEVIDTRKSQPPEKGRARLRGQVIQRLSRRSDILCGWQSILDFASGKRLDLSDPFQESEEWVLSPREDRYGANLDEYLNLR
jgi:proteasome accessory factor A